MPDFNSTSQRDAQLNFRIPSALRRRAERVGRLQVKSLSEIARQGFREYVVRMERDIARQGSEGGAK